MKNYYNLNEDIINVINTSSNLKFLEKSAEIHRSFESYILSTCISEKNITDNSFYTSNGIQHLNNTDCDGIFTVMQQFFKQVTYDNYNYDNQKYDKNIFKESLKKIIDYILKIKKSNARLTTLQLLLKDDRIIDALFMNLQFVFAKEAKKKRTKNKKQKINENFQISATKLSTSIGTILINFYINKHTNLRKFMHFFIEKKTIKDLTVAEEHKLSLIVNAFINNDEEQIDAILSEINIPSNKNNNIKKIVRLRILAILSSAYEKKNVPFIEIQKILEENKLNTNDLEFELTAEVLHLGYLFLSLNYDINIKEFSEAPLFPSKNIMIEQQQTQKYIIIHPILIKIMLETHALNKPYLTLSNREFLKTMKNDNTVNNIYENKFQFIHQNANMNLNFQPECYLNEEIPIFKMKNIRENIYHILKRLAKIDFDKILSLITKSQTPTLLDNESLDYLTSTYVLFDSVYNTDIGCHVIDTNNTSWNLRLYLVSYGLNFNDDASLQVVDAIQDIFKYNENFPEKKKWRSYFYKIKMQRIYVLGLLKDSIAYLGFRLMIIDTFIDSRTRVYLNTDFTNIQLFPFARTILGPYNEGVLTEKNYNNLKKAVIKNLNNSKIKKEVSNMDYNTYKKETFSLLKIYLDSFMKNPIFSNEENLFYVKTILDQADIFNNNILYYIFYHIKKKNRSLYACYLIHKIIELEAEKDYNYAELPFCELDATSSGLQMVSFLLKSNNLAQKVNLVGSQKIDIYTLFAENFNNKINKIHDIILDITYSFYPNEITDQIQLFAYHYHTKYQYWTFDQQSFVMPENDKKIAMHDIFLNMDISKEKNYSNVFNVIEVFWSLWSNNNPTFFDSMLVKNLKEFEWLLAKDDIALLNTKRMKFNDVPFDVVRYMLTYRRLFMLIIILIRQNLYNNKEFFSRGLFKDAIMTYFYNSTSYGRKDFFMDFIIELRNIDNSNLTVFKDLSSVASCLDNYFLSLIDTYLIESDQLFEISNYLASFERPITISNKFFIIEYFPKKEESISIETTTLYKNRGAQLKIKRKYDEFDKREFNKAFIPNLIHSFDAYIVHSFVYKHILINKYLRENIITDKFLLQLTYYINHDNFGSSAIPFLKLIIEDCYIDFHKEDPLYMILKNLTEEQQKKIVLIIKNQILIIDRLNPYFVK